jgi:hypothetical protein
MLILPNAVHFEGRATTPARQFAAMRLRRQAREAEAERPMEEPPQRPRGGTLSAYARQLADCAVAAWARGDETSCLIYTRAMKEAALQGAAQQPIGPKPSARYGADPDELRCQMIRDLFASCSTRDLPALLDRARQIADATDDELHQLQNGGKRMRNLDKKGKAQGEADLRWTS